MTAKAEKRIPVEVAKPLLRLLKPKRIKIAVGGRGSAKSTGVGDLMVMFADCGERICCTREFLNSIDDSIHESLKSAIERMGVSDRFTIMDKEIRGKNGGQLFHKGLARNITSMKSIHGVDKLLIEEGESVSKRSLKVLTPSVRSTAADNVSELHTPPEIWIAMNRGSSKDAIAEKYLKRAEKDLARQGWYEDDMCIIVECNWRDNPWFPPELEMERLDDYENLPRTEYDHIWEGKYSDSVENAIIQPEWFDACIDSHLSLGFDALGQEKVAYDPSDTGDDKAVAYSHGSVIKDVQATGQGRIDTATDWATTFAIDHKPDVFTWDCDGIGMGLKRQIEEALAGKKIELEAFKGSEAPDNPKALYQDKTDTKKGKTNREMFANKRAQYYWMLRDRIYRTYQVVEKGGKVFDADELISFSSEIKDMETLRTELCAIPRKYVPSGRVQLVSKPDMKAQGTDSPNMADAVMMLMRPVEGKRGRVKLEFEGWK